MALQFPPPAPTQHSGFYVFYDLYRQPCIIFCFITACLNSLIVKRKFKYIYLCLYEILFQYDGDFPFFPLCYRVLGGDILIVELVFTLINDMFLNEFCYWSLIYCLYSLNV